MQKYKFIFLLLLIITMFSISATAHAGNCVPNPSGVDWKNSKDGMVVTVKHDREVPDGLLSSSDLIDLIFNPSRPIPVVYMQCVKDNSSTPPKSWEKSKSYGRNSTVKFKFNREYYPQYIHVRSYVRYIDQKGKLGTLPEYTRVNTYTYRVNDLAPYNISGYPASICSYSHKDWSSVKFSFNTTTSWSDKKYYPQGINVAGNKDNIAKENNQWKNLFKYLETKTPYCSVCPSKTENGKTIRSYCSKCQAKENARKANLNYWQTRLGGNYPCSYAAGDIKVTILFGLGKYDHQVYYTTGDYVKGRDQNRDGANRRRIPKTSYYKWYKDSKPSSKTVEGIGTNPMTHNQQSSGVTGFWPDRRCATQSGYGTWYLGVKAVAYNGRIRATVLGPYICLLYTSRCV